MDSGYKIKPFGAKFRNTLWRIAATLVIVVCVSKFELNPDGLSIAIGLAVLLFTVLPIEVISIDYGELLYEKKWFFGLYTDKMHVFFKEIENVSIFGQKVAWYSELVELNHIFHMRNVNNYLEFHLKNGENIYLKTGFTQLELKEIIGKMWEFGHAKESDTFGSPI